jgi:hypothetical protein
VRARRRSLSPRDAALFLKQFCSQALHDRDECFALMLGAEARFDPVDELGHRAPDNGQRYARGECAFDQSPATMDEPALAVARHPWQLRKENPASDPVDEPVIDHPFFSTSVWCIVDRNLAWQYC